MKVVKVGTHIPVLDAGASFLPKFCKPVHGEGQLYSLALFVPPTSMCSQIFPMGHLPMVCWMLLPCPLIHLSPAGGAATVGGSGKDTNRPALVKDLVGRGVTVKFLKENLCFASGNSNHFSELMLNMLGAFAEFERALD